MTHLNLFLQLFIQRHTITCNNNGDFNERSSSSSDTICFSESSQKFSQEDKVIASQLEHVMALDFMMRQEVYQQLINAKNKTLSSLQDILDKDLKFAVNHESGERIAVSSVSGQLTRQALNLSSTSSTFHDSNNDNNGNYSVPVETFAQLEDFRVSSRSLAVVLLGIVNNDPDNVERDIALFSADFNLIQRVRFPLFDNSYIIPDMMSCCCSHIYIFSCLM